MAVSASVILIVLHWHQWTKADIDQVGTRATIERSRKLLCVKYISVEWSLPSGHVLTALSTCGLLSLSRRLHMAFAPITTIFIDIQFPIQPNLVSDFVVGQIAQS